MCALLFSPDVNPLPVAFGYRQTANQRGRRIADNACSYLRGIADYYSSEPRVRSFFTTSKNGTGTQQSQYLFSLFQKRQYVLGIILYRLDGTPSQYMTIDGSEEPLSQASRETFQALIHGTTPYAWEFVPQRGNVLFKQDNSPKICLWHVVKGANNASLIGVMAVTMDTRRCFALVCRTTPHFTSPTLSLTAKVKMLYPTIRYTLARKHPQAYCAGYSGRGCRWLSSGVWRQRLQRVRATDFRHAALCILLFVKGSGNTLRAGMWATIVMAVIVYLCATMPMLALSIGD